VLSTYCVSLDVFLQTKCAADATDKDILASTVTSQAPDWSRGSADHCSVEAANSVRGPDHDRFSSCSDDDAGSTDTYDEGPALATGFVVSVEEARAAKRARTKTGELLDSSSLWGLLRPMVMPDAAGE